MGLPKQQPKLIFLLTDLALFVVITLQKLTSFCGTTYVIYEDWTSREVYNPRILRIQWC